MVTEQGLYEQVVMNLRKDPENKKEEENTKKYNFQGLWARSGYWFDIDHEWFEENLMACGPDFYKNFIKQNLGAMIRKHINYLDYKLVMQKQKSTVLPSSTIDKIPLKFI